MAAGTTIKIKRKAGAFSNGELAAGELGLDVTNSKLYSSVNGTTVFLLDTAGIAEVVDDTTPTLGGQLDAANFRIANLGAPSSGTDATTKNYVDSRTQGFSVWVEAVLNTQTDNTLNPGSTPTTGDRYIITNAASLHANFGSPSGLADDDIVEYNGSVFVVDTDISAVGEGVTCYDKTSNSQKLFNGSDWVTVGGVSDHGGLSGLGDDDHTQYSLIASGASAPSSTPGRVGNFYIDTTADRAYVSTGTASSADWSILVLPGSTDTLTNKTLSSSTNTIDGGTI